MSQLLSNKYQEVIGLPSLVLKVVNKINKRRNEHHLMGRVELNFSEPIHGMALVVFKARLIALTSALNFPWINYIYRSECYLSLYS